MDNLNYSERDILRKIQNGQFFVTVHAQIRMKERNVISDDIISVAKTAYSINWQIKYESYLIKGYDLFGRKLSLAADVEQDVVIITVFYEDF